MIYQRTFQATVFGAAEPRSLMCQSNESMTQRREGYPVSSDAVCRNAIKSRHAARLQLRKPPGAAVGAPLASGPYATQSSPLKGKLTMSCGTALISAAFATRLSSWRPR